MAYKKISGIYKITSPTNKIYIGKSINVNQRKNNYKNSPLKFKSQKRLYNSFLKYGFDGHTFEIIEECEVCELFCRECYWQEYYDVLGKNGLNCILTKCEDHPPVVSEETRKKQSMASSGKNNPMYGKDWREGKTEEELRLHKERMSMSLKGRVTSEETRRKLSENNSRFWLGKTGKDHHSYGKPLKEEAKIKIREFRLSDKNPARGKPRSDEFKRKLSEKLSKPVINYYSKEVLPSIRELSKLLDIKVTTLRSQLNGNNYNQTDWVYLEDIEKGINRKPDKRPHSNEELEIIYSMSIKELISYDRLLYRRYHRHNIDNLNFSELPKDKKLSNFRK